jgi:hypothetical protein
MSNYKIDINLNYNKSGAPSKISEQELKEQVLQAKQLSKEKELQKTQLQKEVKPTSDDKQLRLFNEEINITKNLIKSLDNLNKNLVKISDSTKRKSLLESELVATGGWRFPFSRDTSSVATNKSSIGDMLKGISSTLGNLSLFGISIGTGLGLIGQGVSYMWDKISNIGNAYIQKMIQQASTAGIAGVQRTGMGPYFASDIGAFIKERRMASGFFTEINQTINKNNIVDTDKIGKPSNEIIEYSKLFGIQPQELGRLIGLMDKFSNRKGEETFLKVLGYGAKGGIQTEMQILLNGLQNVLEEAVQEGVNNSDLAQDLAKEIAIVSSKNQNLSVKAIFEAQRGLLELQKTVSAGQVQTLSQLKTYEIGKQYVMEEFKKGKESRFVQSLIQSGMISETEIDKFKTGKIDFMSIDYFTRVALQQRNPEIINKLLLDLYKQFGTGSTQEEKIRNTLFSLTAMGLQQDIPILQNPTLFTAIMKSIVSGAEDISKLTYEDLTESAKGFLKNIKGQEPFSILVTQVEQEMLNLGDVGKKSANAILNLNRETLKMAENLTGVVIPAIEALDKALTIFAEGANKLTAKINKETEKNKKEISSLGTTE